MAIPKNTQERASGHGELLAKALSCKRMAISPATLYRHVKDGLCTRPIKIGSRVSRWPSEEIDAVIAARLAGADDSQVRTLVGRLHELRQQKFADTLAQVAA